MLAVEKKGKKRKKPVTQRKSTWDDRARFPSRRSRRDDWEQPKGKPFSKGQTEELSGSRWWGRNWTNNIKGNPPPPTTFGTIRGGKP